MHFGDAAADAEAEPGAAGSGVLGAGASGVGAEEALEDAALHRFRDTGAGVADRYLPAGVVVAHGDVDGAVGGRVFDRVVEQIEEDAAEQIGVAGEWCFDDACQLDVYGALVADGTTRTP